jgi:hypothetical protein
MERSLSGRTDKSPAAAALPRNVLLFNMGFLFLDFRKDKNKKGYR